MTPAEVNEHHRRLLAKYAAPKALPMTRWQVLVSKIKHQMRRPIRWLTNKP